MKVKPDRTKLGEQLKAVRMIKGLSLREVEAATGISNAYLSQLECGKIQQPSVFFLKKLATVYDVPIETLFQTAGYLKDGGTVIERHSFAAESLKKEKLTPSEADYLAFCLAVLRHSKLEFPNRPIPGE